MFDYSSGSPAVMFLSPLIQTDELGVAEIGYQFHKLMT